MNIPQSSNLTQTQSMVSRSDREGVLEQQGAVLWLTGLSGSGKSTLAHWLEARLFEEERLVVSLDGDNVRSGLNSDLGFAPEDRSENIRRVAEVAHLFAETGVITIVSFISPYRSGREMASQIIGAGDYLEIYVDASVAICEERDPKGLYKKARSGEIPEFTGVSAPYEAPEAPALVVPTGELSIDEAGERILAFLRDRKIC